MHKPPARKIPPLLKAPTPAATNRKETRHGLWLAYPCAYFERNSEARPRPRRGNLGRPGVAPTRRQRAARAGRACARMRQRLRRWIAPRSLTRAQCERMFAMIDERYDRDYQAGRAALNASVGGALARLRAEMSVV